MSNRAPKRNTASGTFSQQSLNLETGGAHTKNTRDQKQRLSHLNAEVELCLGMHGMFEPNGVPVSLLVFAIQLDSSVKCKEAIFNVTFPYNSSIPQIAELKWIAPTGEYILNQTVTPGPAVGAGWEQCDPEANSDDEPDESIRLTGYPDTRKNAMRWNLYTESSSAPIPQHFKAAVLLKHNDFRFRAAPAFTITTEVTLTTHAQARGIPKRFATTITLPVDPQQAVGLDSAASRKIDKSNLGLLGLDGKFLRNVQDL